MGLSIPGLEQSRLHFWRIATHCDQCVRRRSTGFHFQFPLTQSFGDSVPSKSSTLSTLSTFPPSKPLSIPRAPHSEPPPAVFQGPRAIVHGQIDGSTTLQQRVDALLVPILGRDVQGRGTSARHAASRGAPGRLSGREGRSGRHAGQDTLGVA